MNIKIFIPYKIKNSLVLSSNILVPIQTGRILAEEKYDDMIGDDTADNISEFNSKYCELTAHYWVWKNYKELEELDYIGFMQARRHFIFDEKINHTKYMWIPKSNFYYADNPCKDYVDYFSDEKINSNLSENPDCIVYNKFNLKYIDPSSIHTIEDHFYSYSITTNREKMEKIFEELENIIKNDYSDYYDTYLEFINNSMLYCCNSFVMKKDLFKEYCTFLFGILKKLDAKIDSKEFNSQELRFLGYIGEYLLTVFLMQKKKDVPNFVIKELKGIYLCDDYKFFLRRMIKYTILSMLPFCKKHDYYVEKKKIFMSKLGMIN